jgi:hypothetical protein
MGPKPLFQLGIQISSKSTNDEPLLLRFKDYWETGKRFKILKQTYQFEEEELAQLPCMA